jgi:hypothetical protein
MNPDFNDNLRQNLCLFPNRYIGLAIVVNPFTYGEPPVWPTDYLTYCEIYVKKLERMLTKIPKCYQSSPIALIIDCSCSSDAYELYNGKDKLTYDEYVEAITYPCLGRATEHQYSPGMQNHLDIFNSALGHSQPRPESIHNKFFVSDAAAGFKQRFSFIMKTQTEWDNIMDQFQRLALLLYFDDNVGVDQK